MLGRSYRGNYSEFEHRYDPIRRAIRRYMEYYSTVTSARISRDMRHGGACLIFVLCYKLSNAFGEAVTIDSTHRNMESLESRLP